MKNQEYRQFLFLFALLSLFFALSTTISHAKKALGLMLESSVINASLLDSSKNTLVIENSKGLKKAVLVMPKDGSSKSVKIQGNLQDGKLVVDLNKLGAADELKQGSYLVIAKRGGKKLTAEFELNPPTLIVSKLSVPVNGLSKKAKERVLRYQDNLEGNLCYSDPCPPSGNPDEPQCYAPVIEVACDDPACNSGPCTNGQGTDSGITIKCDLFDPENHETWGGEYEYPAEIEGDNIVAEITLETTADYPKDECGIEAEVIVEGHEETECSCIAFEDDASSETGIVTTEINNATTAATDIYVAANTDTQDLAVEGEKIENISFEDLYNETVQKCEPLIELPQSADTSKAVIANIAQDIALEVKDAILNALGTENPALELKKLAAETAAKFGAQCPNFVALPDEALVKMAELATVGFHEIASGLLDPMKLGLDQSAQVFIDIYEKEGVVPGSLKPIALEEAVKAFEAGSAPIYEFDPAKLAENFAEMQKMASELGYEMPKDILVPPGTVFPAETLQYFEEQKIQGASFDLASGCIVQGEYDPAKYSSEFTFNAESGVVAHESFSDVFKPITLGGHDVTISPEAISEFINNSGSTYTTWTPPSGVLDPAPTGWQPTSGDASNPVPTGWHPPTSGDASHPMPTSTQPVSEPAPTSSVPPTTTVEVQPQPTYIPPTTSHPMTH